jgi:hypothetical protein
VTFELLGVVTVAKLIALLEILVASACFKKVIVCFSGQ